MQNNYPLIHLIFQLLNQQGTIISNKKEACHG